MARLPSKLALVALSLVGGLPASGQAREAASRPAPAPPVEIYRREVFTYQRGGRPDPFQPLLSAADLGYRVEDLRLTSVIYSPDPRGSVAVFALADSANRRFRLRTGQRLGGITVAAIYPNRVDLRVEDFGVARIESVRLERRRTGVTSGADAPASDQQGAQPVIIQAPQQQGPAAPAGPLRRGGARNNATQPAAPAPGRPAPRGTSN